RHAGSLPPQLELTHPAMPVASSKQHGMGLGMFLAHATLDKLGGTLRMDSDADGVCTTLTLPLPTSHVVSPP
ncbi:ATP-binding protein, partial [Klebsiella pneumoniae]